MNDHFFASLFFPSLNVTFCSNQSPEIPSFLSDFVRHILAPETPERAAAMKSLMSSPPLVYYYRVLFKYFAPLKSQGIVQNGLLLSQLSTVVAPPPFSYSFSSSFFCNFLVLWGSPFLSHSSRRIFERVNFAVNLTQEKSLIHTRSIHTISMTIWILIATVQILADETPKLSKQLSDEWWDLFWAQTGFFKRRKPTPLHRKSPKGS